MKPSENSVPLAFRHSSKKPRLGAIAGATSKSRVSCRSPSSPPPLAKTLYACAMPRAVPTAFRTELRGCARTFVALEVHRRARIHDERAIDVGARIQSLQGESKRKPQEHGDAAGRRQNGQTGIGNFLT